MSAEHPLRDADARRIIEEGLDHTLLVEAAAGTGKTTGLVRRMVALVAGGKADLGAVAAMTFTTRAAGQLRERFEDELRKRLRDGAAGDTADNLHRALDDIDDLRIGTIHSFCAQLLAEYPVEAGIEPGFSVLETDEDVSLRMRAWQDTIRDLPEKRILRLQELGLDPAQLELGFTMFCDYPDVRFSATPVAFDATEHVAELADTLRAITEAHADPVDEYQERLRSAIIRLESGQSTIADLAAILDLLDADLTKKIRVRSWTDTPRAKEIRDEHFPRVRAELITPLRQRLLAFRYPEVLELLHHASETYDAQRQSGAVLNHNDLLIRTRDMLRDNGTLRRALQQRFPFLLVDEFQDTDPMQAEIIVFLAGVQHDETDWRRMLLRPGALFAVGDPKQSIYRFRRADISVYNAVRELVTHSGGRVLQLGSSFRAVPALCTWVNDTFSDVFRPEADDIQAADVPLQPTRKDGGTLCGAYRIDAETGGARSRENIAEAEATSLAKWISRAVGTLRIVNADSDDTEERTLRHEDILVLFREHQDLRVAAGVFESTGIPHQLESGRIQRGAPALTDFLNALRALIDPEDPVPIVGFLRGPFCGADDTALARYVEAGGVFAFNARAVRGADERIQAGLQYIKDSVRLVRSNPPATVIADMIDRLALLPWAASQPKGWSIAAAFQELLHIAQRRSARGDALAEIVLHLQQAVEQGSIRTSQLRTDTSAVRLMTLHSAKGLEAPVVILAAAAGEKRHEVAMVVDRRSDPPAGSLRLERAHGAFQRRDIARPSDWERKEILERAHVDAELTRLRYVAATRARSACIVSVPDATGPQRHPMWDSLAERAIHALPQPEGDAGTPSTTKPVHADMERTHRSIASGWEQASAPTYARAHPSALHDDAPDAERSATPPRPPARRETETAGGAEFGSAMHALLEHMLLHPDADATAVAASLADKHGLDVSAVPALLKLLDRTRRHPLWSRMTAAEERHAEVPFGLPHTSSDGLPGVMEGTIDLVFRDADGWTIVDYKTDAVHGNVEELAAHHAPQLRAYAAAWEEITGEEAHALLWFLTAEQIVTVE